MPCNKYAFLFFATVVGAVRLTSQVVTTDPVFPIDGQDVTITFDAAEGNKDLKDCNCTVYAHTGVITDKSTSGSDWKYVQGNWGTDDTPRKMMSQGGNKYTISYNVRNFYGVPTGDKILKMAFVFRNQNGSKVGRNTDGSDIFVTVYDANSSLLTNLLSPFGTNLVVQTGQLIPVKGVSSKPARLQVFQNGVLLTEQNNVTALNYNLSAGAPGSYDVEFRATAGADVVSKSFRYVVPLVKTAALPAGAALGANYLSASTLRFELEAPGKGAAFMVGDFNDWKIGTDQQMNRTPDGRYFWLDLAGLKPGEAVRYQYVVDGLVIADPLSELVLDPSNDQYISSAVYPNMPAYPNGKATGFVTVVTPGRAPYPWQTNNFSKPPKDNLVIYELLVRDFVQQHDFKTVLDTLNYLQRLGVNAIQLMPLNEFEGNISWGYNPSFHMALDKYYGPADRLKALIDECHRRGIAVILDVVFNHAFGQSPLCRLYWDAAGNRPAADNPWINQVARHPFNVGFDFNHESQSTRDYVDRCLRFWLSEFRFDGYRFDLSKGFTQTYSGVDVGLWSQYDASRIAILRHYATTVWGVDPNAYVILEHFGQTREETELASYGMMLWNNQNYAFNEATMGFGSNLTGAVYQVNGWTVPAQVTYMESHDEERLMYKNLQFGNGSGGYSVRSLPTALERIALANTIFYTIPGPKMLWQFGELGYDFSKFRCEDGSLNNDCNTAPKPIRWDYNADPNRVKLFNQTADLIYLKRTFPVFRTKDISFVLADRFKVVQLKDPGMNVVALGNFNVAQESQTVDFPSNGWWYEYFRGDSILVNGSRSFTFEPGEYRLYLTQKIRRPSTNTTVGTGEVADDAIAELRVSPNPAGSSLSIGLKLAESAPVRVEVLNLGGQVVMQQVAGELPAGTQEINLSLALSPGLYFARVYAGPRMGAVKFVVAAP